MPVPCVLGISPEVVVNALIVWALNLERRELLGSRRSWRPIVDPVEVVEGDTFAYDYPVGRLVTDVAKVEARSLHWQSCLKQSVCIHLVKLMMPLLGDPPLDVFPTRAQVCQAEESLRSGVGEEN